MVAVAVGWVSKSCHIKFVTICFRCGEIISVFWLYPIYLGFLILHPSGISVIWADKRFAPMWGFNLFFLLQGIGGEQAPFFCRPLAGTLHHRDCPISLPRIEFHRRNRWIEMDWVIIVKRTWLSCSLRPSTCALYMGSYLNFLQN